MTPETNTPLRTVRVAVVGLGFMGVTHLRAYLQNPAAKIHAVCDAVRLPVNGILQGVTGNITKSDDLNLGNDVGVHKSLESVLSDPAVELVDLCTPTPLHPQQTIAALEAGKHVLCEKPLARTSAQAREIIKAQERTGRFVMPAMCMRFWPGWSFLKEITGTARYGKVLAARFRRVTAMPAWSKQGTYASDLGGALFDLHIHDSDFVQFLFGRPSGVSSSGVLSASGSVDHVSTLYHYPGGPSVHAEGSWLLAKGFNMAYTVYCEKATIDFDMSRGADTLQMTGHGSDTQTVALPAGDGYSGEIQYVIDCLSNGRAPSVVTAADAVSALEICEAEERSIQSGKTEPL